MTLDAPGKYYVYAVIDKATSPATLLEVRMSRKEGKKASEQYSSPASLYQNAEHKDPVIRVRRAKLTLFET